MGTVLVFERRQQTLAVEMIAAAIDFNGRIYQAWWSFWLGAR